MAKATLFKGLLHINAARKATAVHPMRCSSFPLDIFGFPSFSYVHDARPYQRNFLEGHLDCWSTYLNCTYRIRGVIPPWTNSPFVSCTLNPEPESFITICFFSNCSCSRPRPKAQYMIWALIPTICIYKIIKMFV